MKGRLLFNYILSEMVLLIQYYTNGMNNTRTLQMTTMTQIKQQIEDKNKKKYCQSRQQKTLSLYQLYRDKIVKRVLYNNQSESMVNNNVNTKTTSMLAEYLLQCCTRLADVPGRSRLRSADSGKLSVPRTSTKTFGPCGFFCSWPSTWNSLPSLMHNSSLSIEAFKRKLKTFCFKS